MPLSDLIARLSADARITPDEVLEVRREVYGELNVTREEAEKQVEQWQSSWKKDWFN